MAMAEIMLSAWHLYVKLACGPHSICAASSVINSK